MGIRIRPVASNERRYGRLTVTPEPPMFRWRLRAYVLHTWSVTDYGSGSYYGGSRDVTKKQVGDERTLVVVASTEAEAREKAGAALDPIPRMEHDYSRRDEKSVRVFEVIGEVEQV